MAVESSVVEVRRIAPESTLACIDAPAFLLGERAALAGADAPAIVLVETRDREVVLRMLDPGVATASEASRR